jgi:hypothetical protein
MLFPLKFLSLFPFLLSTASTAVILSAQVHLPNLAVFIKDANNTFTYSEAHTEQARLERSAVAFTKTSRIILEACGSSFPGCGSCTSYDNTFSSSFCLNVPGTDCIIVHDFDEAHIHYWNKQNCNGRMTGYNGCGNQDTSLNAPGTNSIGFQTGCS